MWLTLVLALIQLFGAIFGPWIRKRLGLSAAAMQEKFSALETLDPRQAVSDLFDHAIGETPFWKIGERFALRIMRSLAMAHADDLHRAAISGEETPTVTPLTEVEVMYAKAALDGMEDASQTGA